MLNIKDPYVKIVLKAIFIAAVGFVLLNVTFLVYATVFNVFDFFIPREYTLNNSWYEPLRTVSVSALILIGYYFVLRTKISDLYKATLTTIPTAIVLVISGIYLFELPLASYFLGSLMTLTALAYLYLTKRPWVYWFAIIIVAFTLLIMAMTGTDI